jgi:two-component system chemotaxis sensor kinase CheA
MGNDDLRAETTLLHDEASHEIVSMLVATVGDDRRIAVRLESIDRLEVFDLADVERSANQEVVQYRDGTMTLHHLAHAVGASFMPSGNGLATIVCGGDSPVGIVVEQILDVVSIPASSIEALTTSTIAARAVIQGRVTDIIDLANFIHSEVL